MLVTALWRRLQGTSCVKHRLCQGLAFTRAKVFAKVSKCQNDEEEAA